MKTVDVTKRVMKKVTGFERRRIAVWSRWFMVMALGLFVGCGTMFVLVVRDLMEKRAFDVLELFTEDREIIAEFWKEVLETFLDELPQGMILIAGIMFIALILFILVTRRKRMIIDKKLHQLEKYS